MRFSTNFAALFSAVAVVNSQDVSFCKEDDCADCPTSLATTGTGYPACVIYDTETVFGGQGFKEGAGVIKYLAHGDFQDPCGGAPGAFIIRSPAANIEAGCGETIFTTADAQCSAELALEETFLVQFCCGSGDCMAAGVPWSKRQDTTQDLNAGVGLQGAYLKFANGTIIPPLEVSSRPEVAKRCDGYKDESYIADGDLYLKTFDTVVVSQSVGPFTEATEIDITYDQTVSMSTTFDVSVGDPFGIISVSVGMTFENSETKGFTAKVPIPAGQRGMVGFTPVFQCTTGTLEDCDGARTDPGESCTPHITNGIVAGNYRLIQT